MEDMDNFEILLQIKCRSRSANYRSKKCSGASVQFGGIYDGRHPNRLLFIPSAYVPHDRPNYNTAVAGLIVPAFVGTITHRVALDRHTSLAPCEENYKLGQHGCLLD